MNGGNKEPVAILVDRLAASLELRNKLAEVKGPLSNAVLGHHAILIDTLQRSIVHDLRNIVNAEEKDVVTQDLEVARGTGASSQQSNKNGSQDLEGEHENH